MHLIVNNHPQRLNIHLTKTIIHQNYCSLNYSKLNLHFVAYNSVRYFQIKWKLRKTLHRTADLKNFPPSHWQQQERMCAHRMFIIYISCCRHHTYFFQVQSHQKPISIIDYVEIKSTKSDVGWFFSYQNYTAFTYWLIGFSCNTRTW